MGTVTALTAAASLLPFNTASGSETRPSTPGKVMWIGGTTRPANMLDGDIWLKESATSATGPEFITTSLNTITQSVAFSQTLVLNGTTPMAFSISAGALPTGLTIHSVTGAITGTPSNSGTYSFTVQAVNAVSSAAQSFTGTVSATAIAPVITTTTLNTLSQGTAFTQTLNATGTTPLTWSASGGLLPAGLTLNSSNGTISGTPTGSGSYSFSITATNTAGTNTKFYSGTIGVTGVAPTITTTTLTTLTAGVAFTQTLASTGSTPMTWGISSGTIPTGLAINSSSGVISGTPATAGAYSFSVQATNSFGSNTKTYSGSVTAGSSASVYSIMGASAPPWSLTSYTDAGSGSWTSHQYYSSGGDGALAAGSKIIGARLYVPTGSSHIGQNWAGAVYRSVGVIWPGPSGPGLLAAYEGNGTKKAGSALVAGWNEVTFDVPQDPVVAGGSWFIGVQIGDGTRYLYDSTYTVDSVKNPQGKNFYLAEKTGTSALRSWYRDTGSGANSYGIDVLMSIP